MRTIPKLAILAASGLIMSAGCATEGTQNVSERPVNLLDARANTHPAMRSGLDRNYSNDYIIGLPPSIIVESAGSERLQKVE